MRKPVETTITNQLGRTRLLQHPDGRIEPISFAPRSDGPLPDEVAVAVAQLKTEAAEKPCGGCADKRKARTWRELAAGTIGLAKSALGIDAAVDDVITARWSACMQCAENDRGVCRKCGCHLSAKVRITAERCPIGRW